MAAASISVFATTAAATAVFALALSAAEARPQGGRTNQEASSSFFPARRPNVLYVRPLFDRSGRVIAFGDSHADQTELVTRPRNRSRDRNRTTGRATTTTTTTERTTTTTTTAKPQRNQIPFEDAAVVAEMESAVPSTPFLLPTFGRPGLILKATEDLRSRDRNQEQFIPPAATNAGVLPLVGEDPSALTLFPPLRPPIKLP